MRGFIISQDAVEIKNDRTFHVSTVFRINSYALSLIAASGILRRARIHVADYRMATGYRRISRSLGKLHEKRTTQDHDDRL